MTQKNNNSSNDHSQRIEATFLKFQSVLSPKQERIVVAITSNLNNFENLEVEELHVGMSEKTILKQKADNLIGFIEKYGDNVTLKFGEETSNKISNHPFNKLIITRSTGEKETILMPKG